jgi:hypothetical protein
VRIAFDGVINPSKVEIKQSLEPIIRSALLSFVCKVCVSPLYLSSNTVFLNFLQYPPGREIGGPYTPSHVAINRDGIHQSSYAPSICFRSFLPTPNSSAVLLVARAYKFLPTLSGNQVRTEIDQEQGKHCCLF